jgi:hypothetical protein
MASVQPTLHGLPQDEDRTGVAVVVPGGFILGEAPTELAEDDDDGVATEARLREVLQEGAQGDYI